MAVLAILADQLLLRLQPVSWPVGLLLALVAPGLPTVAMGAAFPLLFASLPRHARPTQAGLLIGVNLAGAVVGTWWGGNFGIPGLGLVRCTWLAAGAYGLAATLWTARKGWSTLPLLPLLFSVLHLAYGAGFWAGLWHWRNAWNSPPRAESANVVVEE